MPEPIPVDLTPLAITGAALRRLPITAVVAVGGLVAGVIGGAVQFASRPRHDFERAARYAGSLGRLLVAPAPPSPLLAERSDSRRVLWSEISLDDLKRAATAIGGTVNDAYLATLAGALARYHDALGVPVTALSIGIPIDRRVEGTEPAGNQWAPVSIAAPTQGDAATRMRAIGASLRAARSEVAVDALSTLAPVLSRLPSTIVYGPLADAAPRPDVQASNVPGWTIVDVMALAGAALAVNLVTAV
jgi:hypothetical protein